MYFTDLVGCKYFCFALLCFAGIAHRLLLELYWSARGVGVGRGVYQECLVVVRGIGGAGDCKWACCRQSMCSLLSYVSSPGFLPYDLTTFTFKSVLTMKFLSGINKAVPAFNFNPIYMESFSILTFSLSDTKF